MKIIEALRIEKGNAVAIVGAGGKTSLLFALADSLPRPVCLTTTTKLMCDEGSRDFEHVLFSDFKSSLTESINSAKTILITNSRNSTGKKWLGLSPAEVDHLMSFCRQKDITCLIEADGARHLSLKAPADWEPVIPGQVDLVIVVVGLSALGKPLDPKTVFRPEIFSQLTGLPFGETISLEHVLKMLTHPKGGLKDIPSNSRAAIVFNQEDSYSINTQELALINHALNNRFFGVILTCLQKDPEHCEVISNLDHSGGKKSLQG